MIFLLDTNIISEMMKDKPNPRLQSRWYNNLLAIGIASVSWHELQYGVGRLLPSRRKRDCEAFLFKFVEEAIPILPFDQKAAVWLADERVRLTALGNPPSMLDGQIAAVAATNDLTLVTRNEKDFANFEGLRVENWFR